MIEAILAGGPVLIVLIVLSVLSLAVIFWKMWHLRSIGAWGGGEMTEKALGMWVAGHTTTAMLSLKTRTTIRARLAYAAMEARNDATLSDAAAREETNRHARHMLSQARSGLRSLELIVTIAPLLGLLGTVLGMITAFQALEAAGMGADPATLAGGIWEALLTTAAGMGIAIPVAMALTWFESVLETTAQDMEDAATRIFARTIEIA